MYCILKKNVLKIMHYECVFMEIKVFIKPIILLHFETFIRVQYCSLLKVNLKINNFNSSQFCLTGKI